MFVKKDRKREKDTKSGPTIVREHNKKGKTQVHKSEGGSMNQSRTERVLEEAFS